MLNLQFPIRRVALLVAVTIALLSNANAQMGTAPATVSAESGTPSPLVAQGQPVDWWFVFKLNSAKFPGCGEGATRSCQFGGTVQPYKAFGQQFVYADSNDKTIRKGAGCAGDSLEDPVGATFEKVYSGHLYYVIWNDQFYDDPKIAGCTKECGAPWGHSKGVVVWDENGNGFVMQVTTPSWPASGSRETPRETDGNTLGCVKDNDVQVSQHFFSLKLTEQDLVKLLKAIANASVVTDPKDPQIVKDGGPQEVQDLVNKLGVKSNSTVVTKDVLSSGVELISKPSKLNVPPWQLVSSVLGGVPLRAATWWAKPAILSTDASSSIACWNDSLAKPGPVDIAATGQWDGTVFGLTGGLGTNFNHAKIGVSTSGSDHFSIFGDMNQQGTLSGPNCASSQNGRGGLFYVVNDDALYKGVKALIAGGSEPLAGAAAAANK